MKAKTAALRKLLVCTVLAVTFCMTTACGNDTNNNVTDDNNAVPGTDSTVPEDNTVEDGAIEDSTNPVDDMNENNADNAVEDNKLPAEKADGVPDEVNGTNETGGAHNDGVAGDAVDDVIDGAEDVGGDVVDAVEDLGDDAEKAVDDATRDKETKNN